MMRAEGYYWIKLANERWFIGEYLAMDWYVCGMEKPLSKEPVEVNEHSVVSDSNMLWEIRDLKFKIAEAKALPCKCDSTGIIYNQGCYCERSKILNPLKDKLQALIEAI